MFSNLIVSNEKAVIGGLSAGVLTLLSQLGVNSQMTLKEAVWAVVAWVITHLAVYATTNTQKPPQITVYGGSLPVVETPVATT